LTAIAIFIPPFIAGLSGVAHRFIYTYLAILATVYAAIVAASYGLSGASSFIDDAFPKGASLTDTTIGTLYGAVFAVLVVSIALDLAYFSGRGLRALVLRVARYFPPSQTGSSAQDRHDAAAGSIKAPPSAIDH